MDFAALLSEEKRKAAQQRKAAAADKSHRVEEPTTPKQENVDDVSPTHTTMKGLPPLSFEPRYPLPHGLVPFRECDSIDSVYLVPEWISPTEEDSILERVHAAPLWVQLKHRRLQVHGGTVTTTYEPTPLPTWLQVLSASLVDMQIFDAAHAPNHTLINEYTPGDGILPHEDGPMYHPLVAILSLGSEARMTFRRHRQVPPSPSPPSHLHVPRRSLLLFTAEAYTEHLHSIDNVGPVGTRVSLTIRHALP
ncbi:Aste57867_23199 [Aphanomyces stellatus]|uniref:Aste57867_23199 protein n=1 Tax=Aphanomyces stellatus TaxID=120398 RepID=A0A485LMX8_9STRA|nr:hypothetical protein As57867_023128 [Aphanomyces stellatus]VFT99846.1 Aste57867_23199 [Aphanomyces stellatus]